MAKNINDILCEYTSGETTLEETNAALEDAGISFHIGPERNTLTQEEIGSTVTGNLPEDANGWGLLDTGTGTLDKVHIVDGRLGYAVNQVQADGSTNMDDYVYIGGKRYEIKGDRLAEVTSRQGDTQDKPPKKPDMRRRSDLAGQEITQRTLVGDYRISYDDFGYAISAARVGRENPKNGAQS